MRDKADRYRRLIASATDYRTVQVLTGLIDELDTEMARVEPRPATLFRQRTADRK